jgi:PIN domain nuclease of toxin-antitoxin system
LGIVLSAAQLDTHVLQWWSAEPDRLSDRARKVIAAADELVIADITWYELAWLAHHERIIVTIPIESWLRRLSADVRTVGITPAIARAAATLPATFPDDPADRLIYACAVEHGWPLVTKDRRLLAHPAPRPVGVW